ncbi:hypothetical protein HHI36_010236 [Cryptolaemus montrouzieri]|uniref:Uncharacterized protein n=1 Tax=Cryptolaemus montrouzieri TaxID=559131 RepID=A0ABD2MI60_9CUCU
MKTRGGDNNEILCNYCNRKVIDFVECFKCKEFFHPSCLIKEAGVKSSTCQHEVSANSGIQENTSPMDIEIENKFLKMQVEYLQALLSESQSKNLILIENNELLRDKLKKCECSEKTSTGKQSRHGKKLENVANLVRTRKGSSSISVSGDNKLESSDHGTTSRTTENESLKIPTASYANITATQLSDAVASALRAASTSSENVNNNNEWSTVSNNRRKSKSNSKKINTQLVCNGEKLQEESHTHLPMCLHEIFIENVKELPYMLRSVSAHTMDDNPLNIIQCYCPPKTTWDTTHCPHT